MSRRKGLCESVPLRTAVVSLLGLAACCSSSVPPNQVQGLASPGGEWIASVPIEGDPGVWVVTIEDSSGVTVFRDSGSELCGNLSVYWLWDSLDRLWLWNSDDGRTWIYYRFGGEWRAEQWREGCTAALVLGSPEPPEALFPEYVQQHAAPSRESGLEGLVLADSGSWFAYSVTLPPVSLEIPELGESLRSHAVEGLSGFLDLIESSGPGSGAGAGSPLGFLYLVEYSEEPSPAGLVCVSMDGYEFSGGAHGITWHRAFIYDRDTGEFVQPLSLLGDSASCEEFRAAMTDTLERRLGTGGTWIEEGTALVPEYYRSLLPLPDSSGGIGGFRVVFDPYQVAPYAFGDHEVVVRDWRPGAR